MVVLFQSVLFISQLLQYMQCYFFRSVGMWRKLHGWVWCGRFCSQQCVFYTEYHSTSTLCVSATRSIVSAIHFIHPTVKSAMLYSTSSQNVRVQMSFLAMKTTSIQTE